MENKVSKVQTEDKVKKAKAKKKKKNDKLKTKKPFINPYKTTWGQIIIWILCAAMVLGTLATLIYLIVTNVQTV